MTNDEERARILRMVAEGQLSPSDAAQLLEAIEPDLAPPPPPAATAVATAPRPPMPVNPAESRSLVIFISENNETQVHIRIPLGLARAAGRFIPRQAQGHLDEYGINLEQILQELVNTSAQGPLVHIQDSDTQVRIAVE